MPGRGGDAEINRRRGHLNLIGGAVLFAVAWLLAGRFDPLGWAFYHSRRHPWIADLIVVGAITVFVWLLGAVRRFRGQWSMSHQYRALFEGNPFPMWIYDAADYRFLAVNAAACAHYGYTRDEFLGMTILDIRPAEERERVKAAVGSDDSVHGQIWRHRTKGGQLLEVDITSQWVRWDGRRARLTLARDVSEQRRTRAALAASEARLRTIAESGIVGLAIGANDGRMIEANDAYLRMIGYGRDDLAVGRVRWDTGTAPEFRHHYIRVGELLRAGKPVPPWRSELVRKDGGRVPVLVALVPHDGGAISVTLDLTELRLAQQSLEATERRYQQLFERNLAGVFSIAATGDILEANGAFARLAGYGSRDELLSSGNRAVLHRMEDLLRDLEREGVLTNREIAIRCKTGADVSVLANLSLLPAEAEAPRRIEGTVVDLSEYKKLELQFRQAQKMESVGQLAGGVAHDFNNLLTVIIGYGQRVLSKPNLDADIRQALAQIDRAAARAAALTRQLLAFSRQQVFELAVLDVNAVLRDAAAMLSRVVGEAYEIVLMLDPALKPVKADAGQLEQVVMNLVVNARDAMPDGGKIVIESQQAVLDEAYTRSHPGVAAGEYAMVAVTDTGAGMDEATRARMFEPFFTTKPVGRGTGLGLATVFGIAKQSGGAVSVYSELGKGTAMKVYLPVHAGAAARAAGAAEGEVTADGTETILLVEDEPALREFFREVLAARGYRMLVAAGPKEAERECLSDEGLIHLLVSDVIMPHMNGPTLAAELQKHRPDMRVLYLSGYPSQAIVASGTLGAAAAFLQKPFTPTALAFKVRSVLDGVRGTGAAARRAGPAADAEPG